MFIRRAQGTQKSFERACTYLIGAAAFMLPMTTASDAKPGFHPVIIRGIPNSVLELRLAYQATFPNGSLKPSVDTLHAGRMKPGDTLIPGSNPIATPTPGAYLVSITRPIDLDPDSIPAESLWATPVDFGPGSISRIRATFFAPAGPLPGGGFAFGVGAKTGGKDDLATEPRVFTTINVRPGFLVRLNVPFGAVETTNMVLPQAAKDAIFSTTDPQPLTLELTIDRRSGKGRSTLTVAGQSYTLDFTLSDFLVDSGPTITAMGPGIAVNANGPGKTASVHVRDFRIYTTRD